MEWSRGRRAGGGAVGDELCPVGGAAGGAFQYLPARSRTPVYIPHGTEIAALPAPPGPLLAAARPKFESGVVVVAAAPPPSAGLGAVDLGGGGWGNATAERARLMANAATATAEVNITNNTTVLVVDVPVKPIEKLRRAVKKMQRLSRKEAAQPRYRDGLNGSRASSVRPADPGRHVARYDGGRSSLRLDRNRRGVNSDTNSVADREMDSSQLLRENLDLRHRLEEDEANYRRKLDTYRLAQQHQSTLVSRLQAKVLQYKKRCSDLECEIKECLPLFESVKPYKSIGSSSGSALDAAQQHLRESQEEPILDFETAIRRLTDEQARNEKLSKLNLALREQLEESQKTNESLTNDLQKLACDWQQMRDEMVEKEDEWKEEEHFFNEYYNTEHNRMLNLWKDIVAMKRNFTEVQSATQRDLSKLRNEVSSVSNEMVATCSGFLTNTTQSMISGKQHEMKKENVELLGKLNKLKLDYENAQQQIKAKEDKIQQKSKEIQNLNKKISDSDENVQEVSELQEEIRLLLNGLNEIAQTVLHDADVKDMELFQSIPHVHLSSMVTTPTRSKSDNVFRMHNAAAFAENTISSVQAALFKYQSQMHELQVKISSLTEQLILADKQNETQIDSHRKLADKVSEQNDELDSLRAELNLLSQEKESLVKALDSARTEKAALDKNRLEINNMLEAVNTDYEKMLKSNNRLQKIALNLEDEKSFLQNEVDRLTKELESRELTNRINEDRCSQMLDECLTIKEELNRERLNRELLEQNRSEAESLLAYLEKAKGELESELQKVLMERSEVHEALGKAEAQVISLEDDKKKLLDEVKHGDDSKTKYQNQLTDLNNDLGAVRKELLHTEQNRLDLESEKIALIEKCKYLEAEKEKLEVELANVSQERNELGEQLTSTQRKKDVLNEELMRLRHRIEQVSETNARVNKHLEDLVKECEEKQVVLESNEKEITHLHELNLVLKNDKESLEAMLFETQNNLEASEMKRETMEKDIADLLVRQDALKGEITKLEKELGNAEKQLIDTRLSLTQQMKALEGEYKQKIENLKAQNEENCRRLEQEKDQIRNSLEKKMLSGLTELDREKNEEINQLQKKIDNLKHQIEMQNQQYEEALRRAENDKQQALLLAHQDQKALLEKMEAVRAELDEERVALEKLRRESNLKAEQDRSNINTLRDQVTRLTSKMEDMRIKIEDEKVKFENEIEEVKKERENAAKECEELKVELSLSEDRLENIKLQLSDTNLKLKDVEKCADHLRRDLNDTKRQLNESNIEKDKYIMSNKELRDFIKKSEAEKREQARSLEESHQRGAGLEEKICQLENDKSRLQNVCRELEFKLMQSTQNAQSLQQDLDKSATAGMQKEGEVKELLTKLNLEMEDKDKLQQELHLFKKQLFEAERNIEGNQQELIKIRQRIREDEEQWRLREQELIARLEDSRGREGKLEDQKHNLELCLADANQQIQDLKARLGGSEGRVRALDGQLSQLEATKKDFENRLKAIGNIFRRLNVIQQEGLLSTSVRIMGPMRRWSPSRAGPDSVFESGRTDNALEVDPDSIKKTVQSLLQQMAQLERERDDLKIQTVNIKKQLDDTYEVQNKNESKISSMVQCIRQLNEEKGTLEMHLDQKESTLMNESETLKLKIDENQQLREKLAVLEGNLQSGSEEKQQVEERLVKLRSVNSQLETEKQKLREELSRCESRSARLEIQRIAMEGDLNRLQMILQEKDSHLQKMQDRLESQTRAIASLEEKCDSLQSNVEQLNSSLEISNSVEADLRAEIQGLQKSLSDCTFTSQSTSDRIKQLQKTVSNCDNEKRLLVERLERAERALSELHAECKSRADQIGSLQAELDAKEIQRAHLEDQLRFAKYSNTLVDDKDSALTIHKLQIDCCELRGKLEMLEEKLRRVENEKKVLERKLNVERTRSHDKMESSDLLQSHLAFGASSSVNLSYLEHENKDLKQKYNLLEAQLAEKEAELARLRMRDFSRMSVERSEDLERFRAGQLRAEHLLKAREQSHRQQVQHLKNEINNLRKRLDQETKLKRRYLLESPAENLRMRQLRETLADSLRTVSQNPTLDALLLDHETKKLNSSLHMAKSDPLRSLASSRK